MTHPPGKRLPRPGHGKVVAAVLGLVTALGLGLLGEAQAAPRGVAPPASGTDTARPHASGTAGAAATRGTAQRDATGRHDAGGTALAPRDAHAHRLDPAAVPAPAPRSSGPRVPAGHTAAPAAVPHADGVPATVAPRPRRATVHAPATEPKIVPQGAGQNRSGTVIVYGTPAAYGASTGSATARIPAGDTTARGLTPGSGPDGSARTGHGHATAGSARTGNPYGLPGTRPGIVSDAPAGTRHLGPSRQPGGEPAAVAQVPAAAAPLPAADRPRPGDATEAARHTAPDHLPGTAGRAPHAHH
ncbi:hypothetical protein [Streptomyces glaucescens]|uniref:Putative secreted protein n=1 Tax=Streptomyces glaucescens TaxID=1907 RepID=A0A089X992_STRGA|nr:hypothetical protein [Streptomyces glaucescens]AIR97699.1 putative secreted protein [Streptomyces glaucescens]